MLESDDIVSTSTDLIRIQRNIIGFNRDLSALMRNGGDGIRFPAGSISNVLIGGNASTQGNTITGKDEGILLNNTQNIVIQGNVIARSGNNGVRIEASNGVTIGGDAATHGNVIGGNGLSGIAPLDGANNITIVGNTIGAVTITGGTFENQDHGIFMRNVSNVTIGDGTPAGRNVIARNGIQAIRLGGNGSNITINGNYIGTDASGNMAVTNAWRAALATRDAIVLVDGPLTNLAIVGNIIGGHGSAQLELWGLTANGVTIQGNNIGVGADGVSPIISDTVEPLIVVSGATTPAVSDLLIGGEAPGQRNLPANSGWDGILIDSSGTDIRVIGNTIRNNAFDGIVLRNATRAALISNRIYDNGSIGIDLNDDGVTPNDAGDGDAGPNDRLNFPEAIRAIVTGPNQLGYNFALDVPAAAAGYRIEFFASTAADPSGHGEGERFLGHVDIAHGGGVQSFTGTLTTLEPISIGDIISATTTRRTAGGAWDITSEFSAVATADGIAELAVTMASEVFDPPAENPFATPGTDVVLTTTVSNVGNGSTDTGSIFAVISIDAANSFYNAATPALGGVIGFASAAPALTFDPASDLAFSSDPSVPSSMAECTYTPAAGYDPQVRHVCINPAGSLPAGSPEGEFSVRLRARIN